MSSEIVGPGGTVGILGGGQLGRMLALAAARLGIEAHVYAPEEDTPAERVSAKATTAAYDDETALAAFAEAVDVVTTEFENVPAETARFLAERVRVCPSARALRIAQDRVTEKSFLNESGVATAPWYRVDSEIDLREALAELGGAGILKTRRFGYDGKGQTVIADPELAKQALHEIGNAPAILEGKIAFAREISVIAVRSRSGEIQCYDPGENIHEGGILRETRVPAQASPSVLERAWQIASTIALELEYVGVLGVEMFLLSDESVLVNEIAPRVHNTGHWTLEACVCSQFENHIRAVCGLPLGSTKRHSDAVMRNLLGEEVDSWSSIAAEPGTALHVYGKGASRPGRKMGHVTRLR